MQRRRTQGTCSSAAFRAFGGPIGSACEEPWGAARYEAEAAGGTREYSREPAQLKGGQLSRDQPGELAELAIAWCRGTADDPGFIESGEMGGPVAAG